MGLRTQLQSVLEALLESDKVYYQEPPTIGMAYPCIVYREDRASTDFADNRPYNFTQRYEITVIDADPDSDVKEKMKFFPMTLFNRHFTANDLHHTVFVTYF
jgi:hypothetical protein